MTNPAELSSENNLNLRRGWTTGACAAAAARAAYEGLMTRHIPAEVSIRLPNGQLPSFLVAEGEVASHEVMAGVIKDAGDDPDVTHGAMIRVRLSLGRSGAGIVFRAGEGVGVVTRPGLPIPVGEPAINPAPRQLIAVNILNAADQFDGPRDLIISIEIPRGRVLATKTMNGRLGIEGGLSILGTTGVVVPFSCAAWVHAIHSGIDVARAAGLNHIGAATGSTSEGALKILYDFPEIALIDMGDFAGAVFKYLRRHPVARLSLAGGVGKFAKLARGALDLHSGRSRVDFQWLSQIAQTHGATREIVTAIAQSASVGEAMSHAEQEDICLADVIAVGARDIARTVLGNEMIVDVVIINRAGQIIGRSDA
ncbi:MAG: cobalt-precorrin-5B (C(1))-methyltransferase [Alphaproteobacteria bacterium]